METDEKLEILCEEFLSLDESDKDYILEFSQGLIQSLSAKTNDAYKPNAYNNNPYGGM